MWPGKGQFLIADFGLGGNNKAGWVAGLNCMVEFFSSYLKHDECDRIGIEYDSRMSPQKVYRFAYILCRSINFQAAGLIVDP